MPGVRVSGPRRILLGSVGVLLLLTCVLVPAVRAAPAATITGPVSGGVHGWPYAASLVGLGPWDYREREYFASGTATGGGSTALPTPSTGSAPAPYRTRIVLRRPVSAARFNGTVLVEWLNVTSQQDYDAEWSEGYREILRGGYAYIAVSAQPAFERPSPRLAPNRR